MSDFADTLRKRIQASQGGTSKKINPLVVIGLTESILDLGLTDEQLFRAVRAFARQIVSAAHPDKASPNIQNERRVKIFEAFEELDDFGRFTIALRDFRNLKAEDRRETRFLIDSLTNTQRLLDGYRGRELAVSQKEKQLERDQTVLETEKKRLAFVSTENATLQARVSKYVGFVKSLVKKLREEVVKRSTAHYYLSSIGAKSPASGRSVHVFDAQWVVIAHLAVPIVRPVKTPYLDGLFTPFQVQRQNILQAVQSAKLSGFDVDHVLSKFEAENARYESSFRQMKYYQGVLCLSIFQLSSGKMTRVYGERFSGSTLRAVGSLMKGENENPYMVSSREEVLEKISVFLMLGHTLVTARVKGYMPKDQKILRHSARFESSNVIIAMR